MTEELDKLLHELTWHAQSVTSRSGRLVLTLASSQDDKIVRVTEVELDSRANVCHFKDQKVRQTSSESAPEEEKVDRRRKLIQKLLINQ